MQNKKIFLSLALAFTVVSSTYLILENKIPESMGAIVQVQEKKEDSKDIVKEDKADLEEKLSAEEKVKIEGDAKSEKEADKQDKPPATDDENLPVEQIVAMVEKTEKTSTTQTMPSRSQSAVKPEPPKEVKEDPIKQVTKDFNSYVLDTIKSYNINNVNYPYLLNNDYANYNGVTTNLVFRGQTLAKAHPSGNRASHCVGITFEVFFKAMQARNRALGNSIDNFNGLNFNQLHDLMLTWYVANGNKSVSNVAVALEKYGLGKRIHNLESARPGDFIDFSRSNGTGHTVVFLGWIRDNNNSIIGLKYWSSQETTGGINYKDEYFGNVLRDPFYIARAY